MLRAKAGQIGQLNQFSGSMFDFVWASLYFPHVNRMRNLL